MNADAAPPTLYRQDHAGALGPHGLDAAAFARSLAEAGAVLDRLRQRADALPPLALARRADDLAGLARVAQTIRARADDVVVLGIGGASLGAQTLVALADRPRPRLHFVENVDPVTWERVVAPLDPARTVFLVVSRSGGTPETVAQALLALAMSRDALGEQRIADRIVVLTGPGTTPLRALGERYGLTTLDHDPALSGRYSVLSGVGLLPAMIAGLDGGRVRAGARWALERALAAREASDSPPALGAALHLALAREKGVAAAVLMVYADALAPFAAWFVQLWGESLGKGGHGTQPVRALGTTDQHSQLQLFLDGPRDKFLTLVVIDRAGTGRALDPALIPDPSIGYFKGRTLGDLMEAEQKATAEVLIGAGRPTRVIRLPRLDEATLGALLMHVMVETILAADMLGVDAFDQPAVELGKALTKRHLADG